MSIAGAASGGRVFRGLAVAGVSRQGLIPPHSLQQQQQQQHPAAASTSAFFPPRARVPEAGRQPAAQALRTGTLIASRGTNAREKAVIARYRCGGVMVRVWRGKNVWMLGLGERGGVEAMRDCW